MGVPPLNGHDLVAALPVIDPAGAVKGFVVVVRHKHDGQVVVATVATLTDIEWANGHYIDDHREPADRLAHAIRLAARRATQRTELIDGPVAYVAVVQ